MRNWNREYLDFAKDKGLAPQSRSSCSSCSEPLQNFRLAAQGKTPAGSRRTAQHRERIATYFDPLPFWYPPLEDAATDRASVSARRDHAAADGDVPLVGFAERVAAADPRHNYLYVNPRTAHAAGIADGGWAGSSRRRAGCAAAFARSKASSRARSGRGTRSARQGGAWRLAPERHEATKGFLLNHLITRAFAEARRRRPPISNSDPITGQAGWYDVRVRI